MLEGHPLELLPARREPLRELRRVEASGENFEAEARGSVCVPCRGCNRDRVAPLLEGPRERDQRQQVPVCRIA